MPFNKKTDVITDEAIQGSSPSQFRDEDPTPSGTYTR